MIRATTNSVTFHFSSTGARFLAVLGDGRQVFCPRVSSHLILGHYVVTLSPNLFFTARRRLVFWFASRPRPSFAESSFTRSTIRTSKYSNNPEKINS